jgi:dipeptidyl aminopeptidase/acylaminoacyl peptidase
MAGLLARLAVGCVAPVAFAAAAWTQTPRPMSLDDLFAIRTLTDVAPAPTGGWTAVVVQRSWSESPAFRPYNMMGNDQADIWLISSAGSPPHNLTRGAQRRAGYWSPVWSTNGSRLAVLSTEGGDNIRLLLIDPLSGVRQRISERAVDTHAAVGAASGDPIPMRWLDDRHLLVALLPAGAQPTEFAIRRETPSLATTGWRQTHGGIRAAVSVLSTGGENLTPKLSSLVVVDVTTGRSTTLYEGPFTDVAASLPGARLAVAVRHPGVSDTVVLVDTRTGGRSQLPTDLAIDQLRWMPDGRLLAFARSSNNTRADWWVLDSAGSYARNLTAALPSEPQRNAVVLGDGAIVLGAGGKLWRVPLNGDAPAEWGVGLDGALAAIVWPRHREQNVSVPGRIAVSTRRDSTRYLYDVDSSTGVASLLPSPAGRTRIAGFDPIHRRAFIAADHPEGTFLWTTTVEAAAPTRILALNEHLGPVATSQRTLLHYRAASGESLAAVVLLPANYVPGERYPMVTWVYPGVVVTDTADSAIDFWLAKNHAHQDNLNVLAAHGYAVLIPSMPVGPVPRDPYLELPNSVLPAVDAAVAAGIADSSRVAVMGQSSGGFATLGLITQSSRFAAAIAISGYSDLISNYGTFDGERRYRSDAHRAGVQAGFSEGSVIGLGTPPWVDSDRYVRNSPLLHVDRVHTPLLLIHGDLDYVPIQQSEEFFTALQRLGRPAEFARYWGESHGAADSSANARDRWERVLAWLDRWM